MCVVDSVPSSLIAPLTSSRRLEANPLRTAPTCSSCSHVKTSLLAGPKDNGQRKGDQSPQKEEANKKDSLHFTHNLPQQPRQDQGMDTCLVLDYSKRDFSNSAAFLELLSDLKSHNNKNSNKDVHFPNRKLSVNLQATKFRNAEDFAQVLQALASCPMLVDLNLSNYLCCDYLKLTSSSAVGSSNHSHDSRSHQEQVSSPDQDATTEEDSRTTMPVDGVVSSGSLRSVLLQSKTLVTLNLSGQSLNDPAVMADLCYGLQHTTAPLRELHLYSCLLNAHKASAILDSILVRDTIRVLDLGANDDQHLTPTFLTTHMTRYLTLSQSIQTLILDHSSSMFHVDPLDDNNGRSNDLQPFFRAIRNCRTLQQLSLRYCRLTQDLGEALLWSLATRPNVGHHNIGNHPENSHQVTTTHTTTPCCSLKHLNLEFTGFGLRDEGNRILIQVLPYLQSLETLKLYTIYPAVMVPELLLAVRPNTCLQSFQPRLHGSFDNTRRVNALLERNRALAMSQSLWQPSQAVQNIGSAAILAPAMERLPPDANYLVMKRWLNQCLSP
ncbi:hypothetical protein ACA910_001309 [Epithemia clementina (nom. ined.)]